MTEETARTKTEREAKEPEIEIKKEKDELSPEDLKNVSGGIRMEF